jgi:hypothetical protein
MVVDLRACSKEQEEATACGSLCEHDSALSARLRIDEIEPNPTAMLSDEVRAYQTHCGIGHPQRRIGLIKPFYYFDCARHIDGNLFVKCTVSMHVTHVVEGSVGM